MTKRKWIILIALTVLICSINLKITRKQNILTNTYWYDIIPLKEDTNIGTIIIPKIELKEKLYAPESKNNNIEKHVSFATNSSDPKINTIILMAHSGSGKLAYFKDLDKLELTDIIKFNYKDEKYIYTIINIIITKKNGTLSINKNLNHNHLILTTCMPNQKNKQLVIIAEKKKDNLKINPS